MADITFQLFVQQYPTDRLKLVGVEVFMPKKSGKHRSQSRQLTIFRHTTDKPGKEEGGRRIGRESLSLQKRADEVLVNLTGSLIEDCRMLLVARKGQLP